MNIIAEKQIKRAEKPFQLAFFLENVNGSEFLDYDLPAPNYHYKTQQGHLVIMWLLTGYFKTKGNQAYLNDIIARFILTFADNNAKRTKVYKFNRDALKSSHLNELRYFQGLKSIRSRAKMITERASLIGTRDQVFFAIKFFAESLISQRGICPYEDLLDFAIANFETKEFATLKLKCKSIFNWYLERDFKIGRVSQKYENRDNYFKETKMTRVENMKKINKEKAEASKEKIVDLLSGLFKDDYKKKNGSWNISKIAKALNLNRRTVMKHIVAIKTP